MEANRREPGVLCPRCGEHEVRFTPSGAYVSFCTKRLAYLLPSEFSPTDYERLRRIEKRGQYGR